MSRKSKYEIIEEEEEEEPERNLRGIGVEPDKKYKSIPYTRENFHTTLTTKEYSTLIEGSYSDNFKAQKLAQNINYSLDNELSNENNKVYIDDKDDDIVIAYTGTRKNSDYLTDLALGIGLAPYTSRFKNSQKLVDDVKKKYKNSQILNIGDSLGGSLAEFSGDKADRVVTYNKGTSIFDYGKKIRDNQIDIRNKGDYISSLSQFEKGGNKLIIDDGNDGFFNSHNFRNIENLNRLRL
jgi:hypothetical protein